MTNRLVWTPEQSAKLRQMWVGRDQRETAADFDRKASEVLQRSCDSIRQHRVKHKLDNGGRERVMPADFTANFETMTQEQLRRLYATGKKTIKRWSDFQSQASKLKRDIVVRKAVIAACLKGAATNRAKFAAVPKSASAVRRARPVGSWGYTKSTPIPDAKSDLLSMAIRHLQPVYRPVCRAEIFYTEPAAKREAAGKFRVGRMTLTETELLALATKRGFTVLQGFAG